MTDAIAGRNLQKLNGKRMKRFIHQKLEAIQVRKNQQTLQATVAMAAGMAMSSSVFAAKTGTEFKTVSDMLQAWSEGYLGMTIALAAFIIGLAVGLMKQTIMPAVVGIGVALAATLGPKIIISMFTAVI